MSAPVLSESFDAETLANLRYKFTAEINNLSPWAALHCFTSLFSMQRSGVIHSSCSMPTCPPAYICSKLTGMPHTYSRVLSTQLTGIEEQTSK